MASPPSLRDLEALKEQLLDNTIFCQPGSCPEDFRFITVIEQQQISVVIEYCGRLYDQSRWYKYDTKASVDERMTRLVETYVTMVEDSSKFVSKRIEEMGCRFDSKELKFEHAPESEGGREA